MYQRLPSRASCTLLLCSAISLAACSGTTLASAPPSQAGPSATAVMSPPSPTPTPEPAAVDFPNGSLDAGRYVAGFGDNGVTVSFAVPDGWSGRDGWLLSRSGLYIAFWTLGNVYADPCAGVLADPPTGPLAIDAAEALASLPAFDATGPDSVQLGGRDAAYVELAVQDGLSCGSTSVREAARLKLWSDAAGDVRYAQSLGEVDRIWIVGDDDQRVVILAESIAPASEAQIAEMVAIVASMQFVSAS